MSAKKHVRIAVPTTDSTYTDQISQMLCKAMELNGVPDYPFRFTREGFRNYLGHAYVRNCICQDFLRTDAEWLWMIDSDIQPPPTIFDLLKLTTEAHILAPVMPVWKVQGAPAGELDASMPWTANILSDMSDLTTMEMVPPDSTEPIEVDVVGMGCTLIHRSLLEDQRMRLPIVYVSPDNRLHSLQESEAPAIFQYIRKPNGETLLGEDYEFCYRARRLNYKVMLHRGIRTGHMKTVDLDQVIEVREWLQRASEEVAPKDKKKMAV